MTHQQAEVPKATYTVSEAARLIGIESHTLRRLESRGLIPAPTRDRRGRRYTRADIEQIREQYGTRRRKEAYTVAVVNQKGGTGKTTTTVNLAGALAINGHRVLVIDFDPQVNATSTLGVSWRDVEASIADVLGPGPDGASKRLSEIILPLPYHPNLFLAPSSIKLAHVEMSLINRPGRDTRLDSAIEPIRREYDLILIDCPPTLGMLSFNAMTAADGILVPVDESLALQGAGQLLATRKECADIGRRRVALLGGRTDAPAHANRLGRGHRGADPRNLWVTGAEIQDPRTGRHRELDGHGSSPGVHRRARSGRVFHAGGRGGGAPACG